MADPHNEGPIPLPAGRNRQPAPSRSEGVDAAIALLVGLRPPGSAMAAILILIAALSHLDCRAASGVLERFLALLRKGELPSRQLVSLRLFQLGHHRFPDLLPDNAAP